MKLQIEKGKVQQYWEQASCGEDLYLNELTAEGYSAQAAHRYRLEPYIATFADFESARAKRVLEIGVGLGADHQEFAAAGAEMTGIDLTERAIAHVQRRLALFGLNSKLATGDAENLSFDDEAFDVVYSWGVIHHSPNTPKAIAEIHRVLKPGGVARIMIYHKWSFVGFMLWIRYALLRLRPWITLTDIYSRYLESPGTKAYTVREAREMFAGFRRVEIRTVLTHGDLLESAAGQRHGGKILAIARRLWPSNLIRRLAPTRGLFMLINATK